MQTAVALIASALIGLIGFSYFRRMEFSIGGGKSNASRMERFAAADRRGMTDRLGDTIVDRFGLTIEGWEFQLLWAQLGGYYEGKTVGSVLGLAVVYFLSVLFYVMMTQNYSLTGLGMMALAGYYPYMKLKSKANETRKEVKRGLPETAALIAAEMSAGSSAETSLIRSSGLPGPLGKMIREAVSISQKTGRLVFSRDSIEGVIVEHFSKYQMPEVEAFARQIDLVAEKGTDGPKQMNEVAKGLAREYRADIKRAAEKMSNELLMPMTMYIFIPFMLSVFVPLFASIFASF